MQGCDSAVVTANRNIVLADVDTDGARNAFQRYIALCKQLAPQIVNGVKFDFRPLRLSGHGPADIDRLLDAEAEHLIAMRPLLAIVPNLGIAKALAAKQFEFPALFHTAQLPSIAEKSSPRLVGHPQMTGFLSGVPLHAKRLELLLGLSFGLRAVGILVDEFFLNEDEPLNGLQNTAKALGLELIPVMAHDLNGLAGSLANIRSKVEAFIVPRIRLTVFDDQKLVNMINRTGKPAIHSISRMVRKGGLMSYEAAIEDSGEAFARQTVAIMRGTPIARIPVEYPRRFRLALNLATAKAMNIQLPAPLLRRAELIVPGA